MTTRARTSRVAARASSGPVAGIYVRISQDREGKKYGVARQETGCQAIAAKLGIPVHRVYCDNDISASTLSDKPRPEYNKMIADAEAGVITVIISLSTSRLSRRRDEKDDLIKLHQRRGTVFRFELSPDYDLSTAAGRQAFSNAAAADAASSETTSELVALARQQKQSDPEQTTYGGGVRPFGYGVVLGIDPRTKKPVYDYDAPVEEEADLIRRAANEVLAGVALREVARNWTDQGVVSSTGLTYWRGEDIRGLLVRPRLAGILTYKGEEVGHKPSLAILDEEVYLALRAKLTDPSRNTRPSGGPAYRWLGSGIYLCTCGGPVEVHVRASQGRRPRYKCKDPNPQKQHVRCDVAHLDAEVEKHIFTVIALQGADLIAKPRTGVDVPALRVRLVAFREKLAEFARDRADGLISREQMIEGTRLIEQRIAAIQQQLDEASQHSPLTVLVGVDDVREVWNRMPIGHKREIIRTLFEVRILPQKQRARFDPKKGVDIQLRKELA